MLDFFNFDLTFAQMSYISGSPIFAFFLLNYLKNDTYLSYLVSVAQTEEDDELKELEAWAS